MGTRRRWKRCLVRRRRPVSVVATLARALVRIVRALGAQKVAYKVIQQRQGRRTRWSRVLECSRLVRRPFRTSKVGGDAMK